MYNRRVGILYSICPSRCIRIRCKTRSPNVRRRAKFIVVRRTHAKIRYKLLKNAIFVQCLHRFIYTIYGSPNWPVIIIRKKRVWSTVEYYFRRRPYVQLQTRKYRFVRGYYICIQLLHWRYALVHLLPMMSWNFSHREWPIGILYI